MVRGLHAVAAVLVVASLALPNIPAPNASAILEGVRNSIHSTAQAAVMEHLAYKPIMCPNNRPFVICHWDVCKTGTPCQNNQVCVPDYCGRCGAKCLDIALPPIELKIPQLPKFLDGEIPPLPRPDAPCGLNQAINLAATASSVLSKELKVACKDCPEGTVSNGHAVTCTVCPPGTYSSRAEGKCKKCEPGTYSLDLGAKDCKPCGKGTFAPIWGSLVCVPCPLGFSAPEAGARSCKWSAFNITKG
ncbi:hypothetical protein MNEG_7917 [Monoraphidium neglectum]|uniref:Tyrosine-protein kinase ephrin type A/B receptor-like domain-containing protein n=1 Tax=Monoraphidium neglectum TaxID=145388 RepID=A0A0D2M9R3_9CHLO|nr:hypothetical protein MNEG_7917 [Monoraphidium neglectum]KIZ00045.1 hypothetical protein MNEG_7917 [Monoraphidium neglectum]|eukprot:XP_013899064.1 hypothetical protein MNEG_7917 [Monoraphidium neglectum]